MPLEMEYADDVDFLDEEKESLIRLLPIAAEQLKKANLFVNEAKTEFTHIHLSGKLEQSGNDNPIREEEKWRKSKILGSLLCSSSDKAARCIMVILHFSPSGRYGYMDLRFPS